MTSFKFIEDFQVVNRGSLLMKDLLYEARNLDLESKRIGNSDYFFMWEILHFTVLCENLKKAKKHSSLTLSQFR